MTPRKTKTTPKTPRALVWMLAGFAAALAFAVALPVAAQTKWDMPTAYPASNFHTENIQQFANDVDKATAGKLKITVHAGGSLYKANEIKRAVLRHDKMVHEGFRVRFVGFADSSLDIEVYSYVDLRFNVGLTDKDFNK